VNWNIHSLVFVSCGYKMKSVTNWLQHVMLNKHFLHLLPVYKVKSQKRIKILFVFIVLFLIFTLFYQGLWRVLEIRGKY